MAIVRQKGAPSFFITFTTNPNWKEIQDHLIFGQTATDRPDLVVRVFQQKLKSLLRELTTHNILGRTIGYVYTVEYQKRGLPHAHILLIMEPSARPLSCEAYDRFVCAQIPNPDTHPRLYAAVSKFMIHSCTPYCISSTPSSSTCKKGFPKGVFNFCTILTL